MTKRVLLISPYFPPHHAIGTKRAINFVQGLHQNDDWEVIVLASESLSDKNDPSLNTHIPESVVVDYGFVGIMRPVIKLFSSGSSSKKPAKNTTEEEILPPINLKKNAGKAKKSSSSLTPFDQYLWDVMSGVRAGKKLIRKYKPDVIWVNADPWSGFLVADKLSRKFNIPWVADLRDPWSIFEKKMEQRPTWTANKIRSYERKFFSSASKVVLNTETALKEYQRAYPESYDERFTFIRNAFNPRLLPLSAEPNQNRAFTFGYFGGFRKFVPSEFLLEGFASFIKKRKLSPDEVCIEVRGNVYDDFWEQIDKLHLGDYIRVFREAHLKDTVALLRSWDALLLSAISDFRWMISAKFYDYLYARRPILAVSDNPELNRLIEETNSGSWGNSDDPEKTADLFEKFYDRGKAKLLDNEALIADFGVEAQAKKFQKVLEEVLR